MKPTARLITWKEIEGFSQAKNKELFKDEVNREGCECFLAAHPEFIKTEFTAEKLLEFLTHGDLPLIRQNLERAYKSLDLGTLVSVEEPEPKPTKKPTVLKPVAAAQTALPTEEEAESLEKLKDLPHLSDQQRKVRDAKLRSAAIASRNSNRKIALVG
jgi:hypothetical protein